MAVVDLSLTLEDNMPAHKLFQRPVLTPHLTHESSRALNLGVPGELPELGAHHDVWWW